MFARGVSVTILGILVAAGGEVAGELARHSHAELMRLSRKLVERGLAFVHRTARSGCSTADPLVRSLFQGLLGSRTLSIHEAIHSAMAPTLEAQPARKPTDPDLLDRYETLIEHTRLAGREQEAFDLYWQALSGYRHMGRTLGENSRAVRILAGFSSSGRPEDIAPALPLRIRSQLITSWALSVGNLGQLEQAGQLLVVSEAWLRELEDARGLSICLQNLAELDLQRGRLKAALGYANDALRNADLSADAGERADSLAHRAAVHHALGRVATSLTDFETSEIISEETLYALRGVRQTRQSLDLGRLDSAQLQAEENIHNCRRHDWNRDLARYNALIARTALQGAFEQAVTYLEEVRSWTAKSGDMEMIIEGHWIAADLARRRGDLPGSKVEALTGARHAEACGYGLLRIELLTLLARIHVAWPDPRAALQHARHSLDLATDPECGYAWGEADAAHLCGEAHLALGETEQARQPGDSGGSGRSSGSSLTPPPLAGRQEPKSTWQRIRW